jgi:hypothetical protein
MREYVKRMLRVLVVDDVERTQRESIPNTVSENTRHTTGLRLITRYRWSSSFCICLILQYTNENRDMASCLFPRGIMSLSNFLQIIIKK